MDITRVEREETERLLMFGNESDLIMPPEYSENSKARHYREQALDYYQSIYDPQVMDALMPYVAINFFDRVIWKLRAPPKVLLNKQENFRLFLISCLSISWKLRDNDFDIHSFLLYRKMKFGNQGLMKMEMRILQALNWRTKQTVPFRFVPYFLHVLTLPQGLTCLPVLKIIVWTQADIRFTKFRPSAVAASAIICVSAKLFPDDPNDLTRIIKSKYAHFDSTIEVELAECVEMIKTTYQNKINTLVIARGLINDGVGTSQPVNLTSGETSTVPPESDNNSIEKGSQRHGKETVAEEASEAIKGIQTAAEQSSNPADDRESLEEGTQRQGKESVAEDTAVGGMQTVPEQSSSPVNGRESSVKRSDRPGTEPIDEESSEAIGNIQIGPKQSSNTSDGDPEGVEEGFRRPVKRSGRPGKEPIDEESIEAIRKIQIGPKQSSNTFDCDPEGVEEGFCRPVKRSHRPGKEPIDEESSEAIRKIQIGPEQSSNTSDCDPEGVEEGFCRPMKNPRVEVEEPELAVVDHLLMNFELGWDDQNPYSHGYGMCSLCDALARCWPVPIFEAQEQTFKWLRDSWEWLLNLPQHIGTPKATPWESYHEDDSKSSSDPKSYRIQDFLDE